MPRPRLSPLEWDCAQRVFQRRQADEIRSFLQAHPNCIHHTNTVSESSLIYSILSNNRILAELLIEMGANVHDGCHWKNIQHSPLFVALVHNQNSMMELLIQNGADINREVNGMSIVERLIRYQDEYGLEPLQSILDWGADPNRITTWTDRRTRDHDLTQQHPKYKVKGPYLLMAMVTGQLQSARVLLQHADVMVRDSWGRCALSVAIEYDFPMDWIHEILQKRPLNELPLEVAVQYERTDIVRLFLQKGSDPLGRTKSSPCSTVFELACSKASIPVLFEFLQAHPTLCLQRNDNENAAESDELDSCANSLPRHDDQKFQKDTIAHSEWDAFDNIEPSSSSFPLTKDDWNDDETLLQFFSCHSQLTVSDHTRHAHDHSFRWESSKQRHNNDDSATFFTCYDEEELE